MKVNEEYRTNDQFGREDQKRDKDYLTPQQDIEKFCCPEDKWQGPYLCWDDYEEEDRPFNESQ